MKKLNSLLKLVLLGVVGALIGVAVYEVFNFIITLNIGEYTRIDGGVISDMIKAYSLSAIAGVACTITFGIAKKIEKNEALSMLQKVKYMTINVLALVCITSLPACIVLGKADLFQKFAAIYFIVWSIAFIVEYAVDQNNINKINAAIKK